MVRTVSEAPHPALQVLPPPPCRAVCRGRAPRELPSQEPSRGLPTGSPGRTNHTSCYLRWSRTCPLRNRNLKRMTVTHNSLHLSQREARAPTPCQLGPPIPSPPSPPVILLISCRAGLDPVPVQPFYLPARQAEPRRASWTASLLWDRRASGLGRGEWLPPPHRPFITGFLKGALRRGLWMHLVWGIRCLVRGRRGAGNQPRSPWTRYSWRGAIEPSLALVIRTRMRASPQQNPGEGWHLSGDWSHPPALLARECPGGMCPSPRASPTLYVLHADRSRLFCPIFCAGCGAGVRPSPGPCATTPRGGNGGAAATSSFVAMPVTGILLLPAPHRLQARFPLC